MERQLITFDWALKKLLRQKANFGILEGFLTELLKFDVQIENILESEGNQEDEYDKYNQVDILAKANSEELILIELQYDSERDYFHRMLYGASKLVTEYIQQSEVYGTIRKVYSINIVYFALGQGDDYIYEYQGEFVGWHLKDKLYPSSFQKKRYNIEQVADIFPKYYILKINNFDDLAKNTLDEWIYFFKNSAVKDEFKAKGIDQVRENLHYENMTPEEKEVYSRYQKNRRIAKSVQETAKEEGHKKGLEEGREEGREEGLKEAKIKIALNLIELEADDEMIIKATNLTIEEIEDLRQNNNDISSEM